MPILFKRFEKNGFYKTRGGKKVEITGTDRGGDYPLRGEILVNTSEWEQRIWTEDGVHPNFRCDDIVGFWDGE